MDLVQAIRSELNAHTIAVRQAAATLGLAVPALWAMAHLKAHYPTWSEDRIKRELKDRIGLTFTRGHSVEVHVSKVRLMDAQLAKEARALGSLSEVGAD